MYRLFSQYQVPRQVVSDLAWLISFQVFSILGKRKVSRFFPRLFCVGSFQKIKRV